MRPARRIVSSRMDWMLDWGCCGGPRRGSCRTPQKAKAEIWWSPKLHVNCTNGVSDADGERPALGRCRPFRLWHKGFRSGAGDGNRTRTVSLGTNLMACVASTAKRDLAKKRSPAMAA